MISLSQDNLDTIETYEVEEDIKNTEDFRLGLMRTRNITWTPIFHPKQYKDDHPDLSMDQYRLKEKRSKALGV